MSTAKLTAEALRTSDAGLESIFEAALKIARGHSVVPQVHARFYPYAGLSSTIRLRQGRVFVRVSDILVDSPPEVLYALACILICKLYRRKSPQEYLQVYREYTSRPAVMNSSDLIRRHRGYKVFSSPSGKTYDLTETFNDLNSLYFEGYLERPTLSWTPGMSRRVLGHHDHVHGAIIISRVLDSPKIPKFVLEYVVYHEMLHMKHPPRSTGSRTIYHGVEFRADERLFERYEEANHWLKEIAPPARRRRRRTRRLTT
ncbi:MAG TPA: M48 family peptidase [Blastocatellia bacterium]